MTRTEMISLLLNALADSPRIIEARRRRLQSMTTAGLERELLMRGLVGYAEPEDSDYDEEPRDEPVPAAFLGIARDPLYAD